MDEWKVIYKGCYEISTSGQIRSMDRVTTRPNGTIWNRPATLIKSRIDKYGYEVLTLWINGKMLTKKVHRLVADAFIENPFNKPEVNHIDGNKLNNNISNLEWVTSSENKLHAFNSNLMEAVNKKLTKEEAGEIKFLISEGFGNSEIGHLYGVTCGAIYSIRKGCSWDDAPMIETEKRPLERFDISKKLNEIKVTEIKILLKEGFSCVDIARSFNVSRCCISDIKVGKSWSHIKIE